MGPVSLVQKARTHGKAANSNGMLYLLETLNYCRQIVGFLCGHQSSQEVSLSNQSVDFSKIKGKNSKDEDKAGFQVSCKMGCIIIEKSITSFVDVCMCR